MYRSLLIFSPKCGAYLRAALKTIVIPLSTVFTRLSAAALIKFPKCGAYLTNYRNMQLKSSLHLGQNVITLTLLHLGSFMTFRPSTDVSSNILILNPVTHKEIKKGFIKGEALRLLRTNSSKIIFEEKITNFKSHLLQRGYPEDLINTTLS